MGAILAPFNKATAWSAGITALLALTLAGCGGSDESTDGPGAPAAAAPTATVAASATATAPPAPDPTPAPPTPTVSLRLPRPTRRLPLMSRARLGATDGITFVVGEGSEATFTVGGAAGAPPRAHRRGDAHDGPLRRGTSRRPPFDHRGRPPEPQQRSAVQGQVRPHADVRKPQVRDLHRRRRGRPARGVHQGRGLPQAPVRDSWRFRGVTVPLALEIEARDERRRYQHHRTDHLHLGTSSRSPCLGRGPSSPSRTT